MTYSQLLLRLTAAAIFIGATYLLVTDQLCMPTKSECRPVHGMTAYVLFSAAVSVASFFLVAATAPRRGARLRDMIIAWCAFLVLFMGAFFMELSQRQEIVP